MNSALMDFEGKSSHAFQNHTVSPPRPSGRRFVCYGCHSLAVSCCVKLLPGLDEKFISMQKATALRGMVCTVFQASPASSSQTPKHARCQRETGAPVKKFVFPPLYLYICDELFSPQRK